MVTSSASLLQLEALALGAHGARSEHVAEPCEFVRELTDEDLPLMRAELRERNWSKLRASHGMGQLTALRMGHQQLAQVLASGVDPLEAAWMTGRSVAGVRSLLADPAFQELLEYYKANQAERDFQAFQRLVTLGGTALSVLQERLEEAPERFSNNELRQLMEASMDRSAAPVRGAASGAGERAAPVVVNVKFVEASERRTATLEAREVRELTSSAAPVLGENE